MTLLDYLLKSKATRDAEKVEGSRAESDITREIPLGWKIPVEFTRIKKSFEDAKGKRVVTQRMRVSWKGKGKTFIQRGKALYFVDPSLLQWQPAIGRQSGYWKIQFDETWCEPLDKDGKAHRNPIVSLILRDEAMMQLIQIAQQFLPLQITKTMAVAVVVFASMACLLMLGLTPFIAPTTAVHWLNSPPKVVP